MKMQGDGFLKRNKWIALAITLLIGAIILLSAFTTSGSDSVMRFVKSLAVLILLGAILLLVFKGFVILGAIEENGAKLERIAEALEKNRTELELISKHTRLTEAAKSIAFRDADRTSLQEAVIEKLHARDFETTYEIIDEIAHRSEYKDLAGSLRAQADSFRDATDQEREQQVLSHIKQLLDDNQWALASAQIERVIRANPKSQQAIELRSKLIGMKQQRKKELLTEWDEAVKRQDTDQSLEILKELDNYLTPSEALGLQEAATDLFKTKLHNLGVQFSLAVSEQQWEKALEVGKQIVSDFPNSRMTREIKEKMHILVQKVQQ